MTRAPRSRPDFRSISVSAHVVGVPLAGRRWGGLVTLAGAVAGGRTTDIGDGDPAGTTATGGAHAVDRGLEVVFPEQALPGKHLVEDDPYREQVGATVEHVAVDLLEELGNELGLLM